MSIPGKQDCKQTFEIRRERRTFFETRLDLLVLQKFFSIILKGFFSHRIHGDRHPDLFCCLTVVERISFEMHKNSHAKMSIVFCAPSGTDYGFKSLPEQPDDDARRATDGRRVNALHADGTTRRPINTLLFHKIRNADWLPRCLLLSRVDATFCFQKCHKIYKLFSPCARTIIPSFDSARSHRNYRRRDHLYHCIHMHYLPHAYDYSSLYTRTTPATACCWRFL